MDINREIEKKEVQDEIIILDKGIDSKSTYEPALWVCCWATLFPYRGF